MASCRGHSLAPADFTVTQVCPWLELLPSQSVCRGDMIDPSSLGTQAGKQALSPASSGPRTSGKACSWAGAGRTPAEGPQELGALGPDCGNSKGQTGSHPVPTWAWTTLGSGENPQGEQGPPQGQPVQIRPPRPGGGARGHQGRCVGLLGPQEAPHTTLRPPTAQPGGPGAASGPRPDSSWAAGVGEACTPGPCQRGTACAGHQAAAREQPVKR